MSMGTFDQSMWGTLWSKLVRRNAPETSVEAAKAIDTTNMEKIVYEAICGFPEGCIQDDILLVLHQYPYSSVTARFSALKRKGLIEVTDDTRAGKSGRKQRIMKAK